MTGIDKRTLTPDGDRATIEWIARGIFAANRHLNGIVIDVATLITPDVAEDRRFAAVIRTPSDVSVLSVHGEAVVAHIEVQRFWAGMAELLAPA